MVQEPECEFCGTVCKGQCNDPDSCRSCYTGPDDDPLDDVLEECMDDSCPCTCHVSIAETENIIWDLDESMWVDAPAPYEHQGNGFPFMDLAGEIRDKIYFYTLKQYGTCRKSPYFRGNIDTAILSTCRQVNQEARHLPLAINDLWILNPVHALNFFGFLLPSAQRDLVTGLHLDLPSLGDFYDLPFQSLLKHLAKAPITSFGLTMKGRINKEWFTHEPSINDLKVLTGLTHFKLLIGSRIIDDKDKNKIVKSVTKRLTADNLKKASMKRKASDSPSSIAANSHKRLTKSTRLSVYHEEDENKLVPRKALLEKYHLLRKYAEALDLGAVGIRLHQARDAAEVGKEDEFNDLVKSIMKTLEERLMAIWAVKDMIEVPTPHR